MPRYIDADALLLKINLHGTNKFGMLDEDIREFVKQIPTADVAPRAEVAREIFEEIITTAFSKMPSDVLIVGRDYDFTDGIRMGKREAIIDMINILAELKKKYTEEQK